MKHLRILYLATITIITCLTCSITCKQVRAKISYGELVDKITILTIKSERITDPAKRINVIKELKSLQKLFNEYIGERPDVARLMAELKKINEALWDVEDILRVKERFKEFGDDFTQLARSVYITNDKRCAVKRNIDNLLHSHILEEKSYEDYA